MSGALAGGLVTSLSSIRASAMQATAVSSAIATGANLSWMNQPIW